MNADNGAEGGLGNHHGSRVKTSAVELMINQFTRGQWPNVSITKDWDRKQHSRIKRASLSSRKTTIMYQSWTRNSFKVKDAREKF